MASRSMSVAVVVAAVSLLQLLDLSAAQPTVVIGFGEVDFQEIEDQEFITVDVTADGSSSVPIKLIITPFTFDEYANQSGRDLPDMIKTRSMNLDRAEFEAGGRQDFPRQSQELIIDPSPTLSDDFIVSIPINNDDINEAQEAFLIRLEVSDDTLNMAEAPSILLRNEGLTIGIIVDEDMVNFTFAEPTYTVSESAGFQPDTVVVEKVGKTELPYAFNVSLRTGAVPATPGEDFSFQDFLIEFPVGVTSAPVPFDVLPDSVSERKEDFRLTLIPQLENPSDNFRLIPDRNTQIFILDDDVVKVGFSQQNYEAREENGVVEVCATFITEPENRPSQDIGIVFSFYTEPVTAEDPEDYSGIARSAAPLVVLNSPNLPVVCFNISIVNDSDIEPPEMFQLLIDFNFMNDVTVEGCPSNVTILDRQVNECEENLDNCADIATCIDLDDGFDCICPPGYTGDGTVCDDIDECALGIDDCHDNARCDNTPGSFECVCLPGFTGDGRTCEDIDECALDIDDCADIAVCDNTLGSFECVCPEGYTGDGRTCEDIDECIETPDICDDNARCINTIGSFQCVCDDGFKVTADGQGCEDIDECTEGTHDCDINARCMNTLGSFECMCLEGFTGDGRTCEDIDECALDLDNCSPNANCTNTVGSFTCQCLAGFTGDGVECEDIDECDEEPCDVNAVCTNTPGSFVCVCEEGFMGDGVDCSEIPTPSVEVPLDPTVPTLCEPIIVMIRPEPEVLDQPDQSTRRSTRRRTSHSSHRSHSSHSHRHRGRRSHSHSSKSHSTKSHSTKSHSTKSDSRMPPVLMIPEAVAVNLPMDDPCLIILPYDPEMDPIADTPDDEEEECSPRRSHTTRGHRHRSRGRRSRSSHRCHTKKSKKSKKSKKGRKG